MNIICLYEIVSSNFLSLQSTYGCAFTQKKVAVTFWLDKLLVCVAKHSPKHLTLFQLDSLWSSAIHHPTVLCRAPSPKKDRLINPIDAKPCKLSSTTADGCLE